MSAFAEHAVHLLKGGYSPVPMKPVVRTPLLKEWNRLRGKALSPESIEKLSANNPDLGLAVAGGFNCLVPIDADTDDRAILDAVLSALPTPTVGKRGGKGWTAFFWDETGMIDARKFVVPETKTPIVEVLVTGTSTIPPTMYPKLGRPYRWMNRHTLFNTRIDELPVIRPAHIEALERALLPWVPQKPKWEPRVVHNDGPTSDKRLEAYARMILNNEVRDLASMGKDSGRNYRLFTAACKLGKFVHHGILKHGEVENELMGACSTNGLWRDDGQHSCLATFRSGINKASGDSLPVLSHRERKAA